MTLLIIGLILFLGVHSTRLVAEDWRRQQIERLGQSVWKGLYAVVALIGLLMIIIGYAQTRVAPEFLWVPPVWMQYLAIVLTIPAFILLVATYWPGNSIKAKVGHPLLAAVKLWALAHLLANGSVADLVLFGAFLAWAIPCFAVFRRRDRAAGVSPPPGDTKATALTAAAGLVLWFLFAVYLHGYLFGVHPLP